LKDNIKMDLKETGSAVINWFQLVLNSDQWNVFVNTARNLGIQKK